MVDTYTTEILLPFNECFFSDLPRQYAIFSLFIPSILRRFELASVALEVKSTLLKPVGFQNIGLVQKAITHNMALEAEQYQRLEFFGDCILKLFTSVQLMVDHPNWPEGFLTQEKGIRVSNATLDAITRRIGLDKYIITDAFKSTKWRPLYIHEVLGKHEAPGVLRSSKTLADVIESLIGAAFMDDGLDGALSCTKLFFPQFQWLSLEEAMRHLNSAATTTRNGLSQPHLEGLEKLLGYTFRNPELLLEAMTHPSFQSYGTATALSYQRMEFIGDAILDFLVTRRLVAYYPELDHLGMHTLRTAMVNADILGYLCMTHSIDEIRHDPIMDENTGAINIEETTVKRWIWQYMRFTGQAISEAQSAAIGRLNEISPSLTEELISGSRYPWSTFAHFAPEKFFSDIIESTIDAIFVDSCGSFSACDAFLRELGVWKLLDRTLADGVFCLHPKEWIGKLAVEKTVQYCNRVEDGVCFCFVKVGDVQIGEEVKGRSRLDAETKAAVEACEILESKSQGAPV
jgi:dsRNA-specific ribonuclease